MKESLNHTTIRSPSSKSLLLGKCKFSLIKYYLKYKK